MRQMKAICWSTSFGGLKKRAYCDLRPSGGARIVRPSKLKQNHADSAGMWPDNRANAFTLKSADQDAGTLSKDFQLLTAPSFPTRWAHWAPQACSSWRRRLLEISILTEESVRHPVLLEDS